jgi:ABC-type oligopeptide transport system substrate-binding subunit
MHYHQHAKRRAVSIAAWEYSPMSHRVLLLAFTCWGAATAAFGQVEEEDTAPRKPLKKIELPEEAPTRNPNGVALPPGANPALAAFAAKLAFPHDRITLASGNSMRIVPVPLVFGKDKYPDEFGIQPLDDRNDTGELLTFTPAQVRSILHYEQLALNESEALLKLPAGGYTPPRSDRLAAVEKSLETVLAFHEKAVAQERRLGKNWDKFRLALHDKLVEVRLSIAKEAAVAKDWKALREATLAYSHRYANQPRIVAELAGLRLLEAEDAAQRDTPADWELAATLLREFDNRDPMTKSETAARIRTALAARAKQLLEKARAVIDANPTEARILLRTLEILDPNTAGLQELRGRMRTAAGTLVVGTRRIPERMSPALARYDSEKQVVELLFEGLLEAIPDEALGATYRPNLASGKPRAFDGFRELELVPNAAWTDPDGSTVTPDDLTGTLQLHRERRHLPGTVGDHFGDPSMSGRTLKLPYRKPCPDMRDPLTFKVLPARWMRDRKLSWDDESFARNPIGSGPYRLPTNSAPRPEGVAAKDLELVPNPAYGKRFPGQPTIREIRFTEISGVRDLVGEVKNDRVHLLTDVPTADLAKYEALPNVVVATAANTRRIHILAVNHRVAALQNPEVRKGLHSAIDRETILDDVFRAGSPKYHKALAGPFPPETWASPKGSTTPAFQPSVASAKLGGSAGTPLTLIYPDDEPAAKLACERIAKQVTLSGLPLKAEGVAPRAFLIRLEQEHRYDLAYVAYEFPNDWYPLALAQWFDSAAADRGGRNYLGYLAPNTNATEADRRFAAMLATFEDSRDFEGVWKPRALETQAKFAEALPFIPLWQLDRHIVVSRNLKLPYPAKLLNPTLLFADVRNWKWIESK